MALLHNWGHSDKLLSDFPKITSKWKHTQVHTATPKYNIYIIFVSPREEVNEIASLCVNIQTEHTWGYFKWWHIFPETAGRFLCRVYCLYRDGWEWEGQTTCGLPEGVGWQWPPSSVLAQVDASHSPTKSSVTKGDLRAIQMPRLNLRHVQPLNYIFIVYTQYYSKNPIMSFNTTQACCRFH